MGTEEDITKKYVKSHNKLVTAIATLDAILNAQNQTLDQVSTSALADNSQISSALRSGSSIQTAAQITSNEPSSSKGPIPSTLSTSALADNSQISSALKSDSNEPSSSKEPTSGRAETTLKASTPNSPTPKQTLNKTPSTSLACTTQSSSANMEADDISEGERKRRFFSLIMANEPAKTRTKKVFLSSTKIQEKRVTPPRECGNDSRHLLRTPPKSHTSEPLSPITNNLVEMNPRRTPAVAQKRASSPDITRNTPSKKVQQDIEKGETTVEMTTSNSPMVESEMLMCDPSPKYEIPSSSIYSSKAPESYHRSLCLESNDSLTACSHDSSLLSQEANLSLEEEFELQDQSSRLEGFFSPGNAANSFHQDSTPSDGIKSQNVSYDSSASLNSSQDSCTSSAVEIPVAEFTGYHRLSDISEGIETDISEGIETGGEQEIVEELEIMDKIRGDSSISQEALVGASSCAEHVIPRTVSSYRKEQMAILSTPRGTESCVEITSTAEDNQPGAFEKKRNKISSKIAVLKNQLQQIKSALSSVASSIYKDHIEELEAISVHDHLVKQIATFEAETVRMMHEKTIRPASDMFIDEGSLTVTNLKISLDPTKMDMKSYHYYAYALVTVSNLIVSKTPVILLTPSKENLTFFRIQGRNVTLTFDKAYSDFSAKVEIYSTRVPKVVDTPKKKKKTPIKKNKYDALSADGSSGHRHFSMSAYAVFSLAQNNQNSFAVTKTGEFLPWLAGKPLLMDFDFNARKTLVFKGWLQHRKDFNMELRYVILDGTAVKLFLYPPDTDDEPSVEPACKFNLVDFITLAERVSTEGMYALEFQFITERDNQSVRTTLRTNTPQERKDWMKAINMYLAYEKKTYRPVN